LLFNKKLVVLHPGVCDPWQPNTVISIPLHPLCGIQSLKDGRSPARNPHSLYLAALRLN
jgi:hypothetical protein